MGKGQALPQQEEQNLLKKKKKSSFPILCKLVTVLISPAFVTTDPAQMQQEHAGIHMRTEGGNPPDMNFYLIFKVF